VQGKTVFFTDGKSRIDYVLAWSQTASKDDEQEEDRRKARHIFEQNLTEEGLKLEHDIEVLLCECSLWRY